MEHPTPTSGAAISGTGTEFASSEHPDVDAIMARIRERVRAAAADERTKYPRYVPNTSQTQQSETALIDYDELNYLNAHWLDWCVAEEITSHRPILGRFIVKMKRFVIDALLNHVLRGYFDREKQFHMQLVRYLNANARYIDNRDYQSFWQLAKKIDSDVAAMNERMDQLFDAAYSSIQALRAEVELHSRSEPATRKK